jgi:hypothetical protein
MHWDAVLKKRSKQVNKPLTVILSQGLCHQCQYTDKQMTGLLPECPRIALLWSPLH